MVEEPARRTVPGAHETEPGEFRAFLGVLGLRQQVRVDQVEYLTDTDQVQPASTRLTGTRCGTDGSRSS